MYLFKILHLLVCCCEYPQYKPPIQTKSNMMVYFFSLSNSVFIIQWHNSPWEETSKHPRIGHSLVSTAKRPGAAAALPTRSTGIAAHPLLELISIDFHHIFLPASEHPQVIHRRAWCKCPTNNQAEMQLDNFRPFLCFRHLFYVDDMPLFGPFVFCLLVGMHLYISWLLQSRHIEEGRKEGRMNRRMPSCGPPGRCPRWVRCPRLPSQGRPRRESLKRTGTVQIAFFPQPLSVVSRGLPNNTTRRGNIFICFFSRHSAGCSPLEPSLSHIFPVCFTTNFDSSLSVVSDPIPSKKQQSYKKKTPTRYHPPGTIYCLIIKAQNDSELRDPTVQHIRCFGCTMFGK